MPFINRYSVTTNGAITFTGNTLGLSKANNTNAPGTAHSIGTFTTVNTSLRDGTYPLGTTSDYRLNSSSAILVLPAQSTVLYAELIWGGSYNLGGENVTGVLNNTVSLTNNAGVFTVTPDTATASVNTTRYFYVRSANVTSLVQSGGGGTYTVGRVPGTQGDSENSTNHAGWTLAVIYQNATLPSRNMTVFVGNEMVDTPSSTTSAVVSGFSTPTSGPLSGRLLVSAQEGDSPLTGDQMQFGPTAADLTPIYGPNNPVSNFFCSQINNDGGLLDTTGTFGDRNHPTGSVISGGRQGWDITNVDVSSKLVNSQTSANIRGTTSGDVYLINALALQVNINAPVISVTKEASKTTAYINEVITYKITITNSGNATANTLTLKDLQPAGTTFVTGSVTVNGTAQVAANPYTGISLGNLANSQTIVVQFQSRVITRPTDPPQFADQATVTYQFQSVSGGTVFNGTAASSVVTVAAGNYPPTASDVSGTIPEDTSFTGQIPAADPESAALAYTVGSPPAHGTVTLNANGTFTYVPNPNFNGTDSFSVTVSDGSGGTANSLVTIRVTPVNDPPVAQNLSLVTLEDTSLSGKVTAADADGDTLTFSLAAPPANGTIVFGPTGVFTYTPNLNYNGQDSFVYSVSDGNGGTAAGSVTITVTPVNDAPVAANVNLTTAEDTPVSGAVPATDVDGDSLTYTLAAPVTHGSVTLNANGTFVYTPGLNFNGTDSFAVRVSDGKGGTAVANVTIVVTPVNDRPVAAGGSVVTPEDTPVSGKITASDVDGDALTYTLGIAPLHGTVVLAADGSYTYTPLANFNGTDSFTVVVTDGSGGTAAASVQVTVTPVNDAPVTSDLVLVTAEDTPVTGTVTASDADGDALTYVLGTLPTHGTAVLGNGGIVTYTPTPDFNGTDSFNVVVSDGKGGSAISHIVVTVTPVNDPPAAQDVSVVTPEDTPVSGRVLASDADGDALTFALGTPPVNGTAVVSPDGSYTYTPAPDYNGPDSFTVTVSDGSGGTDSAAVTVTVTPVNDPPAASDSALTTAEDTPVSGAVTAADADGDTLTYTLKAPASNGAVTLNSDGTFTYVPAPDFNGSDSFVVEVSDSAGGSAVSKVTVAVTPVNDPPVPESLTLTTPEDTAVSGQVTAEDADGDPLTFALGTGPVNGTATVAADGSYTYTPALNFNGTDSFTVVVSDGSGGTAEAVVTIIVSPVNDSPVTADAAVTTPEDTPLSGAVTAADADGDALSYVLGTLPTHGTVSLLPDGTYTYTPDPDFSGTDSFTVVVSDGRGGSAISNVTVTVTPVNDPPAASDRSDVTLEDTPVSGQVTAADVDGDALTYALGTPPANGTAVISADGTYTYTPAPDFNGTDSFTVTVSDGSGGTATATVTVVVEPVNDPPVTSDVTLTTPEDTPVSGAVVAADADGDVLAFTVEASPGHGTVTLNMDGTFVYAPGPDFNGTDSFVVGVSDGNGGRALSSVTVTVTPVNDPPVADDFADVTPEDIPVTGQVTAVDADGDPLTFAIGTQPANGTAVITAAGTFTYTPNPDFNGTDSFTVTVSDGNGGTDTAVVTITVTPVNDAPVTADLNLTTAEDTPLAGAVSAADADGDALQFILGTGPVNGSVTVAADGTFTYIPAPDFNGTDSFTVVVNDGNGGSAISNVTVTVTPVNDPPVALNEAVFTLEDTPVQGRVGATDADGDTLTFALGAPPLNGTASVGADGVYTYTPALNFNGTDSFTVLVSDGSGGTAEAQVTVQVAPVNDAPVTTDVALTTPEDTPASGTVTATDVDGDALTFALAAPPSNGTAVVNADGTFVYTPFPDFNGTDTFAVQVSDGNGGTAISGVTVTVTPVNDPPAAEEIALVTPEDTPVSGQVTATDADGDSLTFTLGTQPANGTAAVTPAGAFTYTPAADYNGTDTFTVIVSDGNGGMAEAAVTVTVTPVNDAPVTADLALTTSEDTPLAGTVTATDADGDSLTFLLGTVPTNGTAAVLQDGTFTYTPAPDFNGLDSFTVVVNDGSGGSAISNVTVTVTPVNDPPVANDVSDRTAEDTPTNGQITAADPDGDPLTYSLATPPANGTAVVGTDGSYTYTPAPDFNGTDSFTVLVSDGGGGTDTAVVTVEVTPVNDPPFAPPQNLTTPEDTVLFGLIGAVDPDGDPLTYTVIVSPENGVFTVNPDGTFSYTPGLNFNGTDTVAVRIDDGNGGSGISVLNLTVLPVNDPPAAENTSVSVPQDSSVTGRIVATDVDGDTLSYITSTPPANGSVVIGAGGSFTYTPNPGFSGADTFVVQVSDGNGGTDTARVAVTVIPTLNPELGNDASVTTPEDTTFSGAVTGNPPPGNTLVFSLEGVPGNGSASVSPDGAFTYTLNPDFNGTDSFTVRVTSSPGGQIDYSLVTVTVTPVNDAPEAADLQVATPEDIAYSGKITARDADGDTLAYSLSTAPLNGTAAVGDDGTFTYTPNADFNGTDSFAILVDDGNGGTDTSVVTVTVLPVNDAPVLSNASVTVPEDTAVTGTLTAVDGDNDALTFTLLTAPVYGTAVVAADGAFTYTPIPDFNGTDSFTVGVDDGNGGTAVANVTVTVTPVNDPPVAADVSDVTPEDTPVSGQVQAADVDGDALTFALGTPPVNGTAVVTAAGAYTYTPNPDFNGTDSFTVTVSDGSGGTDTATVTITVTPVNDAPVTADLALSTPEDTPLAGAVTAADADGDALTYVLGTPPSHGTAAVAADGIFTYTPAPDFNGLDSFTVVVNDGAGGFAISHVTVTVTPVNDPPVAAGQTDYTAEDTPVTGQVTAADVDGDALTFALGTPPANGTAVVAADGTYTYTPNPDFNGTDGFTVTVSDGSGGTATAAVTVNVAPVNDPPVTADVALTTAEDTPAAGQVTATDADGDALTYVLAAGPGHGSVLLNADGTFTYTPAADFNGTDSFSVTVSDGSGGTAVSHVTVTVTPVNDAPVVADASDVTPEDTPVTGQITAADADGDALTYALGTPPVNGTAVVTAGGTYTYTPNPDFNGTDNFTVTVSDGNGGTATAAVTVTVTPVNDAPVTADLALTTPEDTPLAGAVTATDADGDALTFVLGTGPGRGAAAVAPDGTFTYVPARDFNGTDSFTIVVSDGNGGFAISNVTVVVTPVNDPPVVGDEQCFTTEDTPVTCQLIASDVDGDALSYALGTLPVNGTAVVTADGTYTYTPDPDFNGIDTFTVTVSDGSGGTATATVTVNVAPVNDVPVTSDLALTTPEDTAAAGQITAADADGDALTFTLRTQPTNGSVVLNADGTFTYTPIPDFNGTDSFTVGVDDGNGGTAVANVTVTVTPVNDPPVAADVSDVTPEDTPVSGQVQAADVDGDALTFALGTPPVNGTAVVTAAGAYTYTPNPDFNGTDSFTVTVSDGSGGTDTATVTITVTPVNDAPVTADLALSTPEDTPLAGAVTATDADGDAMTYVLGTPPSHGTAAVAADGIFTYTPAPDFNGLDSFTVVVNDGAGGFAISHVTVTVTPVNDPPVAAGQTDYTAEDTPVTGQVTAADVDGDALTFALGTPPANGTAVVAADGTYTYTPNPDFNGTDGFTVTVSDGSGGTATAAVTVNVAPVNDPPVTADVALTTAEDTPAAGQVTATDADGDALTYVLAAGPGHGSVLLNADGTFTYTPAADFNGTDSFSVTVSDGSGGTAVSHVTVTVTPVNDTPVAADVSDVTPEDTPVTGQITAADADGDALTYALGTQPVNGTAVVTAGGTYTYTPNPDFNGTDSFTVTVSDGNGGTATAAVTVTVTPVNDAPVTADLALSTPEDTPLAGAVTATDADGDELTFLLGTFPSRGTAAVSADGSFVYTPGTDFNGTDSFTVVVDDGRGGSAISNVTITVTPVNDAPAAPGQTDYTAEDTPVSGQIAAFDADGDTLTFTLGTPPVNGSVLLDADGSYIYTPNPDYHGTDSFTAVIADGQGGTAEVQVLIVVTPQNDPPVAEDLYTATFEDTPLNGTVAASDADGDTLSFALAQQASNGIASVTAAGAFSYTPNPNFNGIDSFTVTVSDGAGGTDSAVVTVTVVPVNDAPILGTLSEATAEDTVLNGQITAADPDGDPVVYALAAQAANGTAVVNADGSYTYTPNLNFNGTDFFVVTASDGQGGITSAIVNVTVTPVNDPPFAAPLALATQEDTPVSGTIPAYDPEGDPLVYTVNTAPGNGKVILNADGSFIYTPDPDFNGTDGFTVLVSDNHGAGFVSDVTVTVLPVNDPPQVIDVSESTFINRSVSGTIDAADIDSDVLTYALDTPPVSGTAAVGPGNTYTYTPNPNFIGTDFFRVRVTDESGASGTATITVEVSPVFVGSASETTLTTLQNTPVTGTVPLVPEVSAVYQVSTPPPNGTVSVNPGGSFTYVPNPGFTGSDSFVLTESGTLQTVLVRVVVLPANQAPVVQDAQSSTTRNTPVSGMVAAADPEGRALFYDLNSLPVNGTASIGADGTYTYTPNRNFVGTDSFTVRVTDADGAVSIASVIVTTAFANLPPVAEDASYSTPEDTTVYGKLTAADPDADSIGFRVAKPPAHGTVELDLDGGFRYTPYSGFAGNDGFEVEVTDTYGAFTVLEVSVTVLPVNEQPVAGNIELGTREGEPVTGRIPAADPEGGQLLFELLGAPSNGTVVIRPDGTFTYTPFEGFTGTDVFTVVVTSLRTGEKTLAAVRITVNPAGTLPSNRAPAVSDQYFATFADTPLDGQLQAVDPDNDPLRFELLLPPESGKVSVGTGGRFIYLPDPGFTGSDRFTVLIRDGRGGVSVALVTITVERKDDEGGNGEPVPDTLTARGETRTTSMNTPVQGRVRALSRLGLPLTYFLKNPAKHGNSTVSADGIWTYNPGRNFTGIDVFIIEIANSRDDRTEAVFTVIVEPQVEE
ncbi:Ig-like domain-containing protein [Paenibacillus sp. 1P03SA]|uniref:Ig-like domain-containing protein n=1 Tax=Paenibacillus sp. 1P03SA TaxID=3132294 RepID=UPI0039A30C27